MQGCLPLGFAALPRAQEPALVQEKEVEDLLVSEVGVEMWLGLRVTLGSCFCLYLCVAGVCG